MHAISLKKNILRHLCIDGISANVQSCRLMVTRSIGIVTALNPVLGYEVCTRLAKEALDSGQGVYELVLKKRLMTKDQLDKLLAPESMIGPGSPKIE